MKKIKLVPWLVVVALFFSPVLKAEEPKDLGKSTMRESMLMLGLYLYGINREVEKTVPDYDAVEFLSDSILRVGQSMKSAGGDGRFKTNLKNMIIQAETLNKYSTKSHQRVRSQAAAVMQSCAACHAMGSNPYSDVGGE